MQNIWDWIEENRVPILLSLIWIVSLIGYAIGYFSLYEVEGAAAPPPTMNLLFFAFALAGPLAMIWGGMLIANKAGGLSGKLREQSDAARHLAAELADLKQTVDGQRETIESKLANSLLVLEKQVEASVTEMAGTIALLTDDAAQVLTKRNAAIEQSLSRTENTISATISERFQQLDKTLGSTSSRIDDHMVKQMLALNEMLESRVSTLDETIATGQKRLGELMEKRAMGADGYLQTATEHMETMLASTSARLTKDLDDRASRIDTALSTAITSIEKRVGDSTDRFEKALVENRTQMEAAFARRGDSLERQNMMLETKIPGQLTALTRTLDEMEQTLAANPPATDDQIARRLGLAASDLLAVERKAIGDLTTRMKELEVDTKEMLSRIDRTARLNTAIERQPSVAAPTVEKEGPGLPFADLPEVAASGALDWSAVVGALDLPESSSDVGLALKRAALADRGVAQVVTLAETVQDALAEEGLFLRDLIPEHASPESWKAFVRGQRSEKLTAEMIAIKDDIAVTVARARLRNDTEFHSAALRFVDQFQRLLGRVAGDPTAEDRLVEIAETLSGRAFLLLAQLTGAFARVPGPVED